MKLYAVCWQDVCEPWGWEPVLPVDGRFGTFHWSREEAEAALAAFRQITVDELDRDRFGDEQRRRRYAESTSSVQEYEVPVPAPFQVFVDLADKIDAFEHGHGVSPLYAVREECDAARAFVREAR